MTCSECAYYRLGRGHTYGLCYLDPPQMVGVMPDGKSPIWMRPAVDGRDVACKWFVSADEIDDLREKNSVMMR